MRIADLEAVVEDAGYPRFALMAMAQGGPVAIRYAAEHPERVTRLMFYNSYADAARNETPEESEVEDTFDQMIKVGWARPDSTFRRVFTSMLIPSATEEQKGWLDELQRVSASATSAYASRHERRHHGATECLPQFDVPTLVLHATGERINGFDEGRFLASSIRGARLVPLDSQNHIILANESAWPVLVREVEEFLGPDREAASAAQQARDDDVPVRARARGAHARRPGPRQRRDRHRPCTSASGPSSVTSRTSTSSSTSRAAPLAQRPSRGCSPRPSPPPGDYARDRREPGRHRPGTACHAPMPRHPRRSYRRRMTTTPITLDPIKTKHRAMWALGNYDNVATEVIQDLGVRIVEAAGIAPGDRVLDVAAGSGNASLPAARAGGQVRATDITPDLLQTGRQRSEAGGSRHHLARGRRGAPAVRRGRDSPYSPSSASCSRRSTSRWPTSSCG